MNSPAQTSVICHVRGMTKRMATRQDNAKIRASSRPAVRHGGCTSASRRRSHHRHPARPAGTRARCPRGRDLDGQGAPILCDQHMTCWPAHLQCQCSPLAPVTRITTHRRYLEASPAIAMSVALRILRFKISARFGGSCARCTQLSRLIPSTTVPSNVSFK